MIWKGRLVRPFFVAVFSPPARRKLLAALHTLLASRGTRRLHLPWHRNVEHSVAQAGEHGYLHPQRGRLKRMAPLLNFIAMVITLYIWVVIIGAILSWLIVFDVVNRRNRVVYMIADSLHKLTEPALRPIRRILPDLGGVDISPVILILGLIFLRDVVILGWLV
jgi:YggT family protein